MSGKPSGTNGDKIGTSGWLPLPLAGIIGGFLLAAILVNISSNMIEVPDRPAWQPVTWEFSSYVAIMAALPAIYWAWRRFHWTRLGVLRFFGVQVVVFLLFSAWHIVVMVLIRNRVYALMHQRYDFCQGRLLLELIYESHKDFLTFVLIGGITWAYERLRMQTGAPAQAVPERRIEVRTDGRSLFLMPDEILMAESAGNYVELHLASGKPLLLRATLSAYQARLGADFVRVHRSRLVNRQHIREIAITASGDPHLVLSDGREIAGSRRYRDNLKA